MWWLRAIYLTLAIVRARECNPSLYSLGSLCDKSACVK